MNSKILNRDFVHPADGWYQIEPKGNHPNRDRGLIQVIDDPAITTIVNRFNADADAGKLSHGSEMLIDHEHFKHQSDKETVAYGWLQKLSNRADGIYGQIRWTATGKPSVDGGDYRFFSTEYDPADLKVLNDGKVKKVRPLRLDGLTLTNDPNNKGGRPITNRALAKAPADGCCPDCDCQLKPGAEAGTQTCPECQTNFADAGASAANQPKNNQGKIMKNVAQKLGLAAEASEEAILDSMSKLLNRADITTAALTTLQNEHKTFKEQNQTLLGEQVATLLTGYGVTDEKIVNRLKPVLAALPTHEERVSTLTDFGFKPAVAGKTAPAARVLNRGSNAAAATATETDEAAHQAEQDRATNFMNRAQAIMKETPHTSLATATIMAGREIK